MPRSILCPYLAMSPILGNRGKIPEADSQKNAILTINCLLSLLLSREAVHGSATAVSGVLENKAIRRKLGIPEKNLRADSARETTAGLLCL